MTLDLTTGALIFSPILFGVWLSWRLRVRRELRAWKPCPGYLELKLCPRCDSPALEGEVFCVPCGHVPEDDQTWRPESSRLYQEGV